MAKIVNLFNITKSFPCLFKEIYLKYIYDFLVGFCKMNWFFFDLRQVV